MARRVLVTGVTGQTGAYLCRLLLGNGYEVYGTFRRLSTPNFWRLQSLGIYEKIKLIPADLIDFGSLMEAVIISEPEEVYNMASQSYVGASFDEVLATGEVTGLGVARLLEIIRQVNPKIKFYQASSSEMFGNGSEEILNENSLLQPVSPYALAKLYGYHMTRIYRDAYGIFACNGILFNQESSLRGLDFVTRKITNTVAKIKLGLGDKLYLGNLEARRDWGEASEYAESCWLMLQQEKPDDYVIATNESHSVKEFAERAFAVVGLDWKKYVETDKRFMRPLDVNYLRGDYSKAKRVLGWEPKVKFEQLVEIMVKADLDRWQRWLKGERFAWDAPLYPSEMNVLTRALRV